MTEIFEKSTKDLFTNFRIFFNRSGRDGMNKGRRLRWFYDTGNVFIGDELLCRFSFIIIFALLLSLIEWTDFDLLCSII